ncbi:MAG TPA: NADH-quinone oxidoreductase subunit L, partial [Orrella sp.]
HDAMRILAEEWHGWLAYGLHSVFTLPFYLAIAGIVIMWYCYVINPKAPAAISKALSFLKPLLDNKYYFDWFNEKVIMPFSRWFGKELWEKVDQGVIDNTLVNGSAKVVAAVAAVSRRLQSGYIYHYAFFMIIGLMALITFILVNK